HGQPAADIDLHADQMPVDAVNGAAHRSRKQKGHLRPQGQRSVSACFLLRCSSTPPAAILLEGAYSPAEKASLTKYTSAGAPCASSATAATSKRVATPTRRRTAIYSSAARTRRRRLRASTASRDDTAPARR